MSCFDVISFACFNFFNEKLYPIFIKHREFDKNMFSVLQLPDLLGEHITFQ